MSAPTMVPKCDICKQRLAMVDNIAARVPPDVLLAKGLSPEAAQQLKACESCVKELAR